MFSGSMVALVTPFTKEGKVCRKTLKKLVEFQIENNTSAIVPCGTTGESATLSYKEHDEVINIVIQTVKGRVPVIAGTGSNSTHEAVGMTKHAKKLGADGSLQVNPYYNKPTQKGLYQHFKAIADEGGLPILLYNIASRTGINMLPETIAKLARQCKNIVGVKEASGSLEQMAKVKLLCGDEFDLISGDDALTLPLLAIGGAGVISVVANIVPGEVSKLVDSFHAGDYETAKKVYYELFTLVKAMFIETNPIPVKTSMGLMNLCNPDLRLPMCTIGDDSLKQLKKVLKGYKLI